MFGNVDNIRDVGGPSSQIIPAGMFISSGNGKLAYRNGGNEFVVPWTRKSVVYPLALDESYRFAFGVERGQDNSASIVVFDSQEKNLAGTIPFSPALKGVHVIFEPKDNYMLVFDSAWEWIMLLDLSKPNLSATAPAEPVKK